MNLVALYMLSDYVRDAEEDNAVGKYNLWFCFCCGVSLFYNVLLFFLRASEPVRHGRRNGFFPARPSMAVRVFLSRLIGALCKVGGAVIQANTDSSKHCFETGHVAAPAGQKD